MKNFILVFALFTAFELSGQSLEFCETFFNKLADNEVSVVGKARHNGWENFEPDGNLKVVNLKFHIFRNSDYSIGQHADSVYLMLHRLIKDFKPYNIGFALKGIEYIITDDVDILSTKRTSFNDLLNSDHRIEATTIEEAKNVLIDSTSMLFPHINYDAIDIFLYPNRFQLLNLGFSLETMVSGDIMATGGAAGIPSTLIRIGGDISNNHGLSHEVGHALGLYHTSETICGQIEEQNCELCGDKVCDTYPADQDLLNASNIMTYSRNVAGTSINNDISLAWFTPGQAKRMHKILEYHTFLDSILVKNNTPVFSEVVTAGSYKIVKNNNLLIIKEAVIEKDGDLELIANRIEFKSGFRGERGSYMRANAVKKIFPMNNSRVSSSNKVQEERIIEISSSAYPNPSHDFINVVFTLPKLCSVNASVFDDLGNQVQDLIENRILESGNHSVKVVSKRPGVYYMVLEVKDIVSDKISKITQRLLFL